MKLFSKGSEYAVRAMLQVAETNSFEGFSPREICRQAEIPEAFGRKALAELAKAQIIQGTRGPGGGYRLLREPAKISLLDIVLAVDGDNAFAECPMGLQCEVQKAEQGFRSCKNCTLRSPKCGLGHICPMHDLWKETRWSVIQYLDSTTLGDIGNRVKDPTAGDGVSA